MTFAVVLDLLLKYGPSAVQLGSKLVTAIQAGKGQQEVSAADWAELDRLANQSSADIYARLGISPPPPSAPAPL